MKKIAGLYQSYLRKREENFNEYLTGGNKMKNFQDFLKIKLNAEDYFTAEERLNDLIVEVEQRGFEVGAKYITGLDMELIFQK